MGKPKPPLILITNDDGVGSPGLRAAVEAALPLGQVLVVAPDQQWSGAGRSMHRRSDKRPERVEMAVAGRSVTAYQVDTSPAMAVQHGLLYLADRRPAALISGINFGENVGADVTISGTVGAALEGAAQGIPSLAVSLQTPKAFHIQMSDATDFTAAIHFTRLFARLALQAAFPFDVDVLKVDVPADATVETPWRLTRLSRHTAYRSVKGQSADGEAASSPIDYVVTPAPESTEPDSDIYAVRVDRVVSVTPLSIDLTSRADFGEIDRWLRGANPRSHPGPPSSPRVEKGE